VQLVLHMVKISLKMCNIIIEVGGKMIDLNNHHN